MKIIINQKSVDSEFEDLNFNINAELESNEDTTAYGVVSMLYKALMIEGYMETSIMQALYDVAIDKANEVNYILDNDEEVN